MASTHSNLIPDQIKLHLPPEALVNGPSTLQHFKKAALIPGYQGLPLLKCEFMEFHQKTRTLVEAVKKIFLFNFPLLFLLKAP